MEERPEEAIEETSEEKTEEKTDDQLPEKTPGRRVTRGDVLLLLGILAFSGVMFLFLKLILPRGDSAVISVDGRVVMTLSLSEDAEQKITTAEGENTVRVKGGEVSVISADCPDKLCVKHSAIHTSGETIVCLPHKLIVEVQTE